MCLAHYTKVVIQIVIYSIISKKKKTKIVHIFKSTLIYYYFVLITHVINIK